MTIENFNLHMITPEDGGEKDPELKRLTDELFRLKAPMEDAIAKQNLPLAEEIFKQIEEAKKRLDEYKESLNKKEYPTVEINGEKLELGPTLEPMKWDEIPAKLEEFNKTLKPNEKPWRVPTKEEFEEIGKPIREIWDRPELALWNKEVKSKEIFESLGFETTNPYWSCEEDNNNRSLAYYLNSINGKIDSGIKIYSAPIKLIR